MDIKGYNSIKKSHEWDTKNIVAKQNDKSFIQIYSGHTKILSKIQTNQQFKPIHLSKTKNSIRKHSHFVKLSGPTTSKFHNLNIISPKSYKIQTMKKTLQNKASENRHHYFLRKIPLRGRAICKPLQRNDSILEHRKTLIHRIPTGGSTFYDTYFFPKKEEETFEAEKTNFPLSPNSKKKKSKQLWRKAFIYACSIVAIKAKPPKQETRQDLKRLEQTVINVTRRKIFYCWKSILSTFHEKHLYCKTTEIPISIWVQVLEDAAQLSKTEIITLIRCISDISPYDNTSKYNVHKFHQCMKKFNNNIHDNDALSDSGIHISLNTFHQFVQPLASESIEWNAIVQNEKTYEKKDKKEKQDFLIYATKKRDSAIQILDDAWKQSYDEIECLTDTIKKRKKSQEKMIQFAAPVLKAGWGEIFCSEHKKSLFKIMVAGRYGAEIPTSTVWRLVEEKFEKMHSSLGSMYHIPIHNAYNCMINCVAYGRGLGGLLPKEAVEVLLEYLAMRCQAVFRGLRHRKTMYRAMKMWKDREFSLQKRLFVGWKTLVTTKNVFLTHCKWTFARWKRRSKLYKNKKMLFRVMFWPWFVWKRYAFNKVFVRCKLKRFCYLLEICFSFLFFCRWYCMTRKIKTISIGIDKMLTKKSNQLLGKRYHKWKRYSYRKRGE